jgi:peptide/nickel transport system permease protein
MFAEDRVLTSRFEKWEYDYNVLAYVVRRLGAGVFVLLFVIWFTFSLQYFQTYGALAPAHILCNTHATHACLNNVIHQYGLNKPYFVRLWNYLWGVVVHQNLGVSFKQNPPQVSKLLAVYIPRTFWLAFVSLVLSVVVALPIGVLQAWRRNTAFDYVATGLTFFFYGMPAFVLGFVLLDIFSFHTLMLPDSPPEGVHPWAMFTDPAGFILPIIALTALSIAGLSRFMRAQVLDVLVRDYIRTARAKGCGTMRILFGHTMRNALGPIVVIIGLSIPTLLSGALIIEYVFNYAGIGYETVASAAQDDTYVVLGITIVVTFATIIGNLLADVGLVLLNPRIRIGGQR